MAKAVQKLNARRMRASADRVPITVVDSLPSFEREARKLFGKIELDDLIYHVAQFREMGEIIKSSGGLRKMRWSTDNNRGRSHGARIIYWYGDDNAPLYLIAVYPKSKKDKMSAAELKAARKLTETLKKQCAVNARRRKIRVV
jgi:hypothetical protein